MEQLQGFLAQFGIVGGIGVVWIVGSAVLNLLFSFKTPDEWIVWGEKYPVPAFGIKALRILGTDPAGFLKHVAEVVGKKAEEEKEKNEPPQT